METVITIKPGGEVTALYRDELRPIFDAIGKLEVTRRASDVVFREGKWYVNELLENGGVIHHPKGFINRKDAINYEIGLLQDKYL